LCFFLREEVDSLSMKFAICNETFGDWPIERGFEHAIAAGYTGLEVAPFTLGLYANQISAESRKHYRRTAESFGLEIIGLHWLLAKTNGFHLTTDDLEVRSLTASYLKELVGLCADLGGKVMVLGSPLQRNFPHEMSHERAAANAAQVLTEVVPSLEKHGIRIAVEPLGPQEGNFLNFASQARDLIDAIGSDSIRLHLDVKAMSSEETPIDLMIHCHANDPNRLGPGMGDVDQRPIFKALRDINYQGWVSVEVFDYSPGVETILSTSMQNMKHALASA